MNLTIGNVRCKIKLIKGYLKTTFIDDDTIDQQINRDINKLTDDDVHVNGYTII